ncbi:hypothetical protein ACFW6Y_01950, partial [Streptomyces microflavus]
PTGGGRINPKAAPYKGCGFYSSPDEDDVVSDPTAFKGYRIKPKQIRALSVAYADRRPQLEPVFLDTEPALYYASRWGRILPRIYKAKQLAPTTTPYTDIDVLYPPVNDFTGIPITSTTEDDENGNAGPRVVAASTATTTAPAGPQVRVGSDLLTTMLNAARPAPAPSLDDSTGIQADFGRVIQQAGTPQNRPNPVPQLLADAHNAVVAAGGRMHTADLAALLQMEPLVLGTELGKLLRKVSIERPGKGTVRAGKDNESKPGYTAETLAAAMRAYNLRDGQ